MTFIIPAKIAGLILGPYGKLIGIGALALLLGWGARLWLNAHDDKVWKESRTNTALSMKDDLEKEYKIRLEAATIQIATQTAARDKAEQRLDQITGLFDQAFNRLSAIQSAIKERQVIYVEKAAAVPASDLDPALRSVSNDIAGKPTNGSGETPNP